MHYTCFIHALYILRAYTCMCIYAYKSLFYKILQRYVKTKTFCSKAYPHIVTQVKNLSVTLETIFPNSQAMN